MSILAIGGCIVVSVIILLVSGSSSPVTGFVWGVTIAVVEAVAFSFFFDRMAPGSLAEMFRKYSIGALIRIPLLLVLFGIVAVLLKVHGIGLIVGVGVGMAVAAVLSFKKTARLASKLQQSRE